MPELIPASCRQYAGYILNWPPANRRAQTDIHVSKSVYLIDTVSEYSGTSTEPENQTGVLNHTNQMRLQWDKCIIGSPLPKKMSVFIDTYPWQLNIQVMSRNVWMSWALSLLNTHPSPPPIWVIARVKLWNKGNFFSCFNRHRAVMRVKYTRACTTKNTSSLLQCYGN